MAAVRQASPRDRVSQLQVRRQLARFAREQLRWRSTCWPAKLLRRRKVRPRQLRERAIQREMQQPALARAQEQQAILPGSRRVRVHFDLRPVRSFRCWPGRVQCVLCRQAPGDQRYNLLFLWFGAIGLGTAYYMIPKVIGRPVYSYHLATIGFWTYAFFSSWMGMARLVDGPFPAWMITASIAATILTIIPVATVGLNHHMTMLGYFHLLRYSPTLRFTVFGAMSYTVFSALGVLISLRSMARYFNFAQASVAYSHLGLYAFFSMIIFGSMYYIVPRLVGREWRYATLIKLHFWGSVYGIGLMTLMLLAGGLIQGLDMENPSLPFTESTQSLLPYFRGRSLAGILMTVSHFIFAFHFGLMLFGLGRTASVPTFLNPVEAEGSEVQL